MKHTYARAKTSFNKFFTTPITFSVTSDKANKRVEAWYLILQPNEGLIKSLGCK